MKNIYLHNAITDEFSSNPSLFDSAPAFQLLCHYAVLASSNPPDELARAFSVTPNLVARWLMGTSAPYVPARKIIAHDMLHIAKEADFSTTPYSQAFKPALAQLFARASSDFSSRSLFCLAFHTASLYEPDICRKVADDTGFTLGNVVRWARGHAAPHVSLRPKAIACLAHGLNS